MFSVRGVVAKVVRTRGKCRDSRSGGDFGAMSFHHFVPNADLHQARGSRRERVIWLIQVRCVAFRSIRNSATKRSSTAVSFLRGRVPVDMRTSECDARSLAVAVGRRSAEHVRLVVACAACLSGAA
jgi:hypothetical protein